MQGCAQPLSSKLEHTDAQVCSTLQYALHMHTHRLSVSLIASMSGASAVAMDWSLWTGTSPVMACAYAPFR